MSDDETKTDVQQPESETPLKDYGVDADKTAAPPRSIDQIVEDWWDNHIRGSVVGQHTQIWNHLMVCKDHLKEMLRR
jgi:sarcosine oxidase delta subunit